MDAKQTIALALDPGLILKAQGIAPDPWQNDFLRNSDQYVLLLCSRGAGKSRSTSAKALHKALFTPKSLTLLVSRSQRQAQELFRYVKQGFNAIGRPVALLKETETQLELANGSRIVALPGKEANIRSYQGVDLLILDEAARIPDDLYASVSPMTAVRQGQQIALSTPFGQRGFFFTEWEDEEAPWKRFKVTWKQCPRITPEFMAEETRKFGASWVDQEYNCSFVALEGLVYPDFGNGIVDIDGFAIGKPVGGIDWGWRNPFAALWGVLDRDDVLWIQRERYLRETPLHEHAAALPRNTMFFADPAGPTEIAECRAAGLTVRKGDNSIRLGIAAVNARIQTGRLKVNRHCRNLISESKLYRYPSKSDGVPSENPIDDHNHALGALRYLVSKIDARFIAKLRKKASSEGPIEEEVLTEAAHDYEETQAAVYGVKPWLRLDNPAIWNDL